ncbi:thioredoxin fold domain-containing protein [Campylobacter upsaliensis]|uniref:thioredoxin fold domain-containing protein n=1 Tax=Campylobacter upsaliensis TaxID=28080 RepID=UPI00214A5D1B|nr:thioredoxin fold domain-containing protein [Campylobacter upsaliensis]MCR2112184.1 thioredoxin fold domain-containing protein [Campylobacter upsaliensis]
MKFYLPALMLLLSISNAKVYLSEAQKIEKIKGFYEENFAELKINYIEKTMLNGLEAFIFEFELGNEKSKEVIFVKDDLFFTDAISFNDLNSLEDEAQAFLSQDKFQNILKALEDDKAYIITLGSGGKESFVFSDPECPYCKKHLQKLDENYLKEHKVHFIFFTIHNNFNLIAGLYKELKNKQKDSEKLEIIRLFFENPSYKDVSKEEAKRTEELFEKYKNLGVLYTPFEIKMKN